ncbi:hypothetical protein [Lentibacillus sp. JNUCC-1]|uniref:hypothetical protein n=1 Tax=Lentibacillus sp. JNUCC-1 TaxID=2654513 RepID=UPI0018D24B42|nr:hypothetical protein [Lentibacillus sp. JNUCC-1]
MKFRRKSPRPGGFLLSFFLLFRSGQWLILDQPSVYQTKKAFYPSKSHVYQTKHALYPSKKHVYQTKNASYPSKTLFYQTTNISYPNNAAI